MSIPASTLLVLTHPEAGEKLVPYRERPLRERVRHKKNVVTPKLASFFDALTEPSDNSHIHHYAYQIRHYYLSLRKAARKIQADKTLFALLSKEEKSSLDAIARLTFSDLFAYDRREAQLAPACTRMNRHIALLFKTTPPPILSELIEASAANEARELEALNLEQHPHLIHLETLMQSRQVSKSVTEACLRKDKENGHVHHLFSDSHLKDFLPLERLPPKKVSTDHVRNLIQTLTVNAEHALLLHYKNQIQDYYQCLSDSAQKIRARHSLYETLSPEEKHALDHIAGIDAESLLRNFFTHNQSGSRLSHEFLKLHQSISLLFDTTPPAIVSQLIDIGTPNADGSAKNLSRENTPHLLLIEAFQNPLSPTVPAALTVTCIDREKQAPARLPHDLTKTFYPLLKQEQQMKKSQLPQETVRPPLHPSTKIENALDSLLRGEESVLFLTTNEWLATHYDFSEFIGKHHRQQTTLIVASIEYDAEKKWSHTHYYLIENLRHHSQIKSVSLLRNVPTHYEKNIHSSFKKKHLEYLSQKPEHQKSHHDREIEHALRETAALKPEEPETLRHSSRAVNSHPLPVSHEEAGNSQKQNIKAFIREYKNHCRKPWTPYLFTSCIPFGRSAFGVKVLSQPDTLTWKEITQYVKKQRRDNPDASSVRAMDALLKTRPELRASLNNTPELTRR